MAVAAHGQQMVVAMARRTQVVLKAQGEEMTAVVEMEAVVLAAWVSLG